jgi:hypothetical protein
VFNEFGYLGSPCRKIGFHCATDVRYSTLPPRVAALRRSSREIVDGDRPDLVCDISHAHTVRAKQGNLLTFVKVRYLPVGGAKSIGGIPPA